ncbi:hypothetical protein BDW68DRAFT_152111 [Aspergillus falconensis]
MPLGLGKAIGDPNDDDYVAQILAEEAQDSSMKYSALGMEAYMPARPAGAAPKPNTRFLRHIIKETDNHNAALKRKEEREARGRMRQLRDQTSSSAQASSGDHRHRHSHRSGVLHSRRDGEDRKDSHRSRRRGRRSRSTSSDRDRLRASRRERDRDDDRHRRSRRSHRHRYRSYSSSRSRSPRVKDSDPHDRRRRHRRRSSSLSRSPKPRENRKDQDSLRRQRSAAGSEVKTSGNDSDPLEEFVGPLPKEEAPVRSRGRGAFKPNNSSIDAHFAPDYDPSLDVQPEYDEVQASRPSRRPVAGLMTGDDDWELALEALRDRARWKQKGEDRLREAGFNSDIVERWKSSTPAAAGSDEGLVENVKWSTKSEGREWDRGKFVDDDGHINVKASW